MRVSSISSAATLSFSKKNSKEYNVSHPPITYDTNKVKNTLLCLAGIGLAGATYIAIKDAGNNSVKTAITSAKNVVKDILPEQTNIAARNTEAVNRYNAAKARTKLASLEKRIANNEFANFPEHAIMNIEKQKAKLIRQCTQLATN